MKIDPEVKKFYTKLGLSEELQKLYYKNRNLRSWPASFDKQLNKIQFKLDPVVIEIAKINKIDLYATFPALHAVYDKIILATALLVINHPKITEAIQKIREDIGIKKLLEYTKEWDSEGDQLFNSTLSKLKDSLQKKLVNSLNIFFSDVGRNLLRKDWTHSIATYILTGTLPLPSMPHEVFVIQKTQRKELMQYPAIVIKKRIKKRELNQLIEFIRERASELAEATNHLPTEPIKRSDMNVTKLAIGLWIYRNEHWGVEKMQKWIDEKYEKDESYFGEYAGLGKESFPNFKSDTLVYLNHLYPF